MSKLMKSTRNNEWLKMYPEVPYEVGLSHLESHPEKLDKEKSTIEYDILAAALRYFSKHFLFTFDLFHCHALKIVVLRVEA